MSKWSLAFPLALLAWVVLDLLSVAEACVLVYDVAQCDLDAWVNMTDTDIGDLAYCVVRGIRKVRVLDTWVPRLSDLLQCFPDLQVS